ncbi:MAG: hypothetical protein KIT09_03435 [Bryobacteraceae bacterium]|nr:hypothetical protein [Bryobacteraceae bacterium]
MQTFGKRIAILIPILAWPMLGQYAATYVTGVHNPSLHAIVATAVTDTNYAMCGQHVAYATARIVSPGGRVAQYSVDEFNVAVANTTLSIEREDGVFMVYNWYPGEFCYAAQQFYAAPTQQQGAPVPKWVAIQSTTVSGSPIDLKNGRADFDVGVVTSYHCEGPVTIIAHATKVPSDIEGGIRVNGGSTGGASAQQTYTMARAGSQLFQFDVVTHQSNANPGTITASAGYSLIPADCTTLNLPGVVVVRAVQVKSN